MPSTALNSVCSQLLTSTDLSIDKILITQIEKEKIVTKIVIEDKDTTIKIYSKTKLYLSAITPTLHFFGFEIIDETAYSIQEGSDEIHIKRFNLHVEDNTRILKAKENIEHILSNILLGNILNKGASLSLVYEQNFSIRQMNLVSAFIEYVDQAIISINYETILKTVTKHHDIAKLFVHYFSVKFDPKQKKRESSLKEISQLIDDAIKLIPNIMDDRILKITYSLIQSLTRTNYYLHIESIAFKIDVKSFSSNLKGLQPNIETFVYNQEFSGLHLRMSKISRGGLRWSERHEDYRQEIKSLMITQEGKNSIIIPDGAKGGFVIKHDPSRITKEYFTEIYTKFINALLDVVDNRIEGEIVRNENVIAYDDDDAYFVVAADKGTASMSDVANSIAIERGFWLGDAFASGGSNGYGHKDLGITAKGSLTSTNRFFIEKGIDYKKESITVVGIGSMNGDVFGNGMLDSKEFKLLAAIGHKDIFIDPNPICISSYEERQRLFLSKNGGWGNYNKSLISKGGGVFLRSDKSITLSVEIQKMLPTTKKVLSGEELVKKLLCMQVDMLFNGGVGTYVKSSDENSLDLGDKQNEAVRVDASDLKADVVCEGGNLGFTQKARIEYAINGGKINLDGIDNAAGVNTSDHEVNLKILLNAIEAKGLLSNEDKNRTLHSLTEQVVNMVLWNNYLQSLAISRDEILSQHYLNDFVMVIEILEQEVTAFNRTDFHIPKNENIHEIISAEGKVVRPILSSIFSYAKIFIKSLLMESDFTNTQFAQQFLFKYFPKSFTAIYEHEIAEHPLKNEIIATMVADKLINLQGSTFIIDFAKHSKENLLQKITAYLLGNQLFGANDIRHELFRHDFDIQSADQYKLLSKIEHTLNFSTRWMVKYLDASQLDALHVLDYKEQLFELLERINTNDCVHILEDSTEFNRFFSVISYLRFAIAAIVIKENTNHSFEDVGILFYLVVNEFKILEMISALDDIETISESEITLRHQVLQFIEFIVVHYTQNILAFQRVDETPHQAFDNYVTNEKESFINIKEQIDNFMLKEVKDIKDITVTVNQLMASAI